MILSDLHTPFDNCEQTSESTHDWHLDRANYSEQQIHEMPTWIKTNKEEYTIDEQYDIVDVNSFSEMQKLAYDIVNSHFHDASSNKEPLCLIINGVAGTGKSYLPISRSLLRPFFPLSFPRLCEIISHVLQSEDRSTARFALS